jgi:hypothetical protein
MDEPQMRSCRPGEGSSPLLLPVAYHCIVVLLGFETTSLRVAIHSVLGSAFYGAFLVKVILVRSRGLPGWALPVAGGLLFAILAGLWLTSSLYLFSTNAYGHHALRPTRLSPSGACRPTLRSTSSGWGGRRPEAADGILAKDRRRDSPRIALMLTILPRRCLASKARAASPARSRRQEHRAFWRRRTTGR